MVGSERFSNRLLNIYLPLVFYVVFLLFPFYWMTIVSFKPTNDLFDLKFNPFWIQRFTLENYTYLFRETSFSEWVKNTIIVSVVSTVLSLACSIFAGYALRDCLRAVPFPYVELHITNIEKRGIHSLLAETAVGMVTGFGMKSYLLGLDAMLDHLAKRRAPKARAAPKRVRARRAR